MLKFLKLPLLPMEQKTSVFITSLALECDNLINVLREHSSYCEKKSV